MGVRPTLSRAHVFYFTCPHFCAINYKEERITSFQKRQQQAREKGLEYEKLESCDHKGKKTINGNVSL